MLPLAEVARQASGPLRLECTYENLAQDGKPMALQGLATVERAAKLFTLVGVQPDQVCEAGQFQESSSAEPAIHERKMADFDQMCKQRRLS